MINDPEHNTLVLLWYSQGISMGCPGFENWTYDIEKVKTGGIGVVHKNIGRDNK